MMTDPRTLLLALAGLSLCAFSIALWAAVGLYHGACEAWGRLGRVRESLEQEMDRWE